jgi:hypothetical protein
MHRKIKTELPYLKNDPARWEFQYLEDLSTAYWYSQVLFSAVEVDLFGRIEEGASTPAALAAATGCQAAALARVVYRRDGALRQNSPVAAVDADALPPPDTQGFPPSAYGRENAYVAAVGIEGKRGCDLACGYCLYPFLGGRRLRLRDPARIVDDMERLQKEHGIVQFHYGVFGDSPTRAESGPLPLSPAGRRRRSRRRYGGYPGQPGLLQPLLLLSHSRFSSARRGLARQDARQYPG